MIEGKQPKKWTNNTYFIYFYIIGGYILIHKNKKRRGISPSSPINSNIFTIKEGHTFIK